MVKFIHIPRDSFYSIVKFYGTLSLAGRLLGERPENQFSNHWTINIARSIPRRCRIDYLVDL